MNQKFSRGDIVYCINQRGDDFKVRVLDVVQVENGSYFYEIEPLEFKIFTREVPQDQLYYYKADLTAGRGKGGKND